MRSLRTSKKPMRLADLVRPHKRLTPDVVPTPTPTTFAEMLKADGKTVADRDIEEKFPVRPRLFTTKGTKVFRFRYRMTAAEIKAAMRDKGYRPAAIEHLLAYCAEHPVTTKEYSLIALAAFRYDSDGDRQVVKFLVDIDGKRRLMLTWGGAHYQWPRHDHFLGIRMWEVRR